MPVQLSIYTKIPKAPTKPPRESTDAERVEWTKRMQKVLNSPGANSYGFAHFETDAGILHMQSRRFGTSVAALWLFATGGEGNSKDVAGASLLLRGLDGKDDADALAEFRKIRALADFPAKDFVEIQAKNRPCLAIFYLDPAWYESGFVELGAAALALAIMAPAGVTPTMTPQDREITPEEDADQRRQVADICEVFRIIQTDWVRRKRLLYTVRPSEPIEGRPVSEIMHVTFWTGVQGQGRTLSINGLVSLFLMLGDYVQKVPNLKHLKNPQTRHEIRFRHEPAVIEKVLKSITMSA